MLNISTGRRMTCAFEDCSGSRSEKPDVSMSAPDLVVRAGVPVGRVCASSGPRNPIHSITSSASAAACSYRVFGCFHRTSPDNLSGRFSLEHGWLFRERIDASALFRGGLFDDNKFCKARQQECAILLQFLVTHGC